MPKGQRVLSVFVDESGTFQHPDPSSRYYIVALVLHDQSVDISRFTKELDVATENLGLDPSVFANHTGPLIRKEKVFAPFRREWRAKVFKLMFDFTRRVDFKYHCLCVDKKFVSSPINIVSRLNQQLTDFLESNKASLAPYDKIKVYYDCGQAPVTNLLHKLFSSDVGCEVEFAQDVKPEKYKLFQVADLICSVALIEQRLKHNERMTPSEYAFFGGLRAFKKNILKYLKRKEVE